MSWKWVLEDGGYIGIDEFKFKYPSEKHYYGLKSVYAKETFHTTKLPCFIGTKNDVRPDPPNVWYWQDGIIWDNTRGIELMYLHFIYLKTFWKKKENFFNVGSNYSKLRIDSNGIFSVNDN